MEKRIKRLVAISSLLLAVCGAADAQVNYNFNELGKAIHHGDFEAVKSLIESGTDPNEMQNVTTPLGIATDRNRDDAFDLLMEQPGIEINTVFTIEYLGAGYENAMIKNALLCAVDSHNIRMANILLDRGAQADFLYSDKRTDGTSQTGTTLMNSFRVPYSEQSEALAQRIADNTSNLNREFQFLNATKVNLLYKLIEEVNCKQYNQVVKSVIDRGADYKAYFAPDESGLALVRQYASAADVAAMEKNLKYTYQSCPQIAALKGNSELLDYMISKGAPVDRYDDKGAMLMLSCTTAECAQVLMNHGVDINVGHPISGWPLIFSAVKLSDELLEGILKLGADPNVEINGVTVKSLLQGVSSKQRKSATKILEKYGYKG